MPSYDGSLIFGNAVIMTTADNPRTSQENAFFGLNGVESLDGGQHGRFTTVTGFLFAPSAPSLNASISLFRSYNDGSAYILVDSFGNAWPDVKMESFEPNPKVRRQGGNGDYWITYTARFKHLS